MQSQSLRCYDAVVFVVIGVGRGGGDVKTVQWRMYPRDGGGSQRSKFRNATLSSPACDVVLRHARRDPSLFSTRVC